MNEESSPASDGTKQEIGLAVARAWNRPVPQVPAYAYRDSAKFGDPSEASQTQTTLAFSAQSSKTVRTLKALGFIASEMRRGAPICAH